VLVISSASQLSHAVPVAGASNERSGRRVSRLGVRVAGDEDGVVDAGFLDQLDALAQLSDPRKRGRALERVVADLFRQHHFSVTINPGIARPRQTDVFATRVTDHYLIECKWRAGKATIGDVDALRSRWSGQSLAWPAS
jgi:Restriction endonuclease